MSLLTFEPRLRRSWPADEVRFWRQSLEAQGIRWHRLPYHRRPSLPATVSDVLAGAAYAARLARREPVSIFHARAHVAGAMAALAKRVVGGRFLFDIRGFNLNAILELDPSFLVDAHHEHHDEVESFVFRSEKPFDGDKLEQFLSGMIQVYGPDLLRYKGVLWMKGKSNRVVFQGVHMMMGGDMGKPWAKGEKKASVMVFIGKKLPKDLFIAGLEQCLA